MSTKNVTMQTIALPKGSTILGTSNRYHGDGSVSANVYYSVPKDSAEQTPEPPISAIVIRDGKPRHLVVGAEIVWSRTRQRLEEANLDEYVSEEQFYRVLPVYFTLDDWRRLERASADSAFDTGGTSCLLHSKLLSIIENIEVAEKQ